MSRPGIQPLSCFSAILTAAAIAGVSPAFAESVSWITPGNGAWTDTANWSSKSLPGPSSDVLISQSPPVTVTLSFQSESINSLTINNTLSLQSCGTISATNGIQLNGGLILNDGFIRNSTITTGPNATLSATGGGQRLSTTPSTEISRSPAFSHPLWHHQQQR